MKLTKPVSASGSILNRLVAIGNAGTAFTLTPPPENFPVDGTPTVAVFRSFKASGFEAVEVGTLHAAGKPCGLPEWDAALFVSHRGVPVRVMPLGAAVKAGLVTEHTVLLRRDGKESTVTVYGPAKWTPAQRQPKFLATLALPAGRVESKLVQPDKRNAGYTGHVLPLAMAKAPAAPAKAPAAPAKAPKK